MACQKEEYHCWECSWENLDKTLFDTVLCDRTQEDFNGWDTIYWSNTNGNSTTYLGCIKQ